MLPDTNTPNPTVYKTRVGNWTCFSTLTDEETKEWNARSKAFWECHAMTEEFF